MIERGTNPVCDNNDCFGCEDGHCIVLTSNNFNKHCPFYKTREQAAEEKAYCRYRMDEMKYKENHYAE